MNDGRETSSYTPIAPTKVLKLQLHNSRHVFTAPRWTPVAQAHIQSLRNSLAHLIAHPSLCVVAYLEMGNVLSNYGYVPNLPPIVGETRARLAKKIHWQLLLCGANNAGTAQLPQETSKLSPITFFQEECNSFATIKCRQM